MAWISKKELKKKLTELEKKVKQLDPENVSQILETAIKELDQFKVVMLNKTTEEVNKAVETLEKVKEGMPEVIKKAVDEKTKDLSDRLEKNETEIKVQKEKLDNLRSRIKENGQKVVKGIFGVLEETFGPIEEKPEEPEEPELEEVK